MKRSRFILITLCMMMTLSACGGSNEDNPAVIIENQDDTINYTLISADRGDVILTERITCTYKQTTEQTVSFPVSGKLIDKVYVNEGDSVKKGDLLAELSSSNLEEQIARLKYQISRNELQLSYLDTKFDYDISAVYLQYWGIPNMQHDIDLRVEQIRKDYDLQRESFNDSLEFDRMELAKAQSELKNSRLYAQIDGQIYKIADYLEGSTSSKDKVIITIVDNTACLFETAVENPSVFHENEPIEMQIVYSDAAGTYELIPYHMSEWGDTQTFEIYDGPETASLLEVNTSGTMKVEVEHKTNVLRLPSSVVYQVDDSSYVYVLDENNMRTVHYIETGIVGDDYTEILSGIEEGDKVVKK